MKLHTIVTFDYTYAVDEKYWGINQNDHEAIRAKEKEVLMEEFKFGGITAILGKPIISIGIVEEEI